MKALNDMKERQSKRSTSNAIIILIIAALVLLLVLAGTVAAIFLGGRMSLVRDEILGTPSYPAFVSSVDKDGDGIDDQADVLQGAKDYVATEPQYKSKYYAGGYPDDKYGVCTDVVGFGLKAAGYDLRELVDSDIKASPADYGMSAAERDSNIDFRRVPNLKVWFDRNAVSLTTDLSDPAEWQGGDIVLTDNHAMLLSDRRNHKGLPYVIHLHNKAQTAAHDYEQDCLKKYANKITGHYRISE